MKKRNIFKRNSGFIVASILAAGTSFFAADTVLTELRPGSIRISNGNDDIVIVESESETNQETDTYETNPFTITSSGAVMDQVESEVVLPGETELENGETDESEMNNGEADGTNSGADMTENTDAAEPEAGETDAAEPEADGADEATADQIQTEAGSTGEDGQQTDGNVVDILDPGGGYYTDSSSGGSSSNNSSGSSSGNSSSNGNDIVIVDSGSSGSVNNNVSGSYENGIFSPDDLILWHINSRYISEEELWNYDAATIRYIRNEIFALHGRIFESEDLRSYFSQKAWYVPTYAGDVFDPDMEYYLNDYEWANLQLILAYEELLYE